MILNFMDQNNFSKVENNIIAGRQVEIIDKLKMVMVHL